MDSAFVGIVVVPGVTALVLLLIFTFVYQQSRAVYFRAWQIAWACYCAYYALMGVMLSGHASGPMYFVSELLLFSTAFAILISLRLLDGSSLRLRWYDGVIAAVGVAWSIWNLFSHYVGGQLVVMAPQRHLKISTCIGVLLLYSGIRLFRVGLQREAVGYRLLALALCFWSVLLIANQFASRLAGSMVMFGQIAGPLPQMLLGISMLVVLFENERRVVQENALFFSTLDVDHIRLTLPADLVPSFQKILGRVADLAQTNSAAILISEIWRSVLPTVGCHLAEEFMNELKSQGLSEYLSDVAYRRGGLFTFRNLATLKEPLPPGPPGKFDRLQHIAKAAGVQTLTVVNLQTRERNFGVILLPHVGRRSFGSSQMRMLMGVAMQIATALENHVAMQETQRRTREYELLTQVGQVISSHLNVDQVLRAIHKEIGLLVDTHNFYVAFLQNDEVRFDLEVLDGEVKPKRSRKVANGLTEYVIRSGQPLLVKSNMSETRVKLGVTFIPDNRSSKSFCAVPIFTAGRALGIMAAMNYDREFVYSERDIEVLQTAAGQVAVAVENARLFEEQHRRARYLGFLNSISKAAISSQDAEQMLDEIVRETQSNFELDYIGIGMLDYASKEIEIKAEAASSQSALGRRIPLGVGIMGKVARTGETALVRATGDGHLLGILPEAHSVLCLPLTYAETLLGILNVESKRDDAFAEQEVLILRTLADLVAAALHNAFIFQKLQQQSITDGLTGVKTRRFFLEAVSAEWKRASRSARPFSVVMIDLDKFKEVNDSMGHLEGDLVLARVGRLLEQKCRQSNIVSRYGGDEFVILMPETGIEQAQILSERLRLWMATDPMLNERKITGSFGVASFPLHGSTVEDIIRVADAGMYVSKHAGGNRVSTAEDLSERETTAVQRQMIASYIEGFLQREHMGPEAADELVTSLRKMREGLHDDPAPMREAVLMLARAAEMREMHSAGHGHAVARYATAIARELGMDAQQLSDVSYAALVHDVGKVVVAEKTLQKPGPLSEDEYYIVKMHAPVSAEIVACIPNSSSIQSIVRHHHEHYDGSGYPDGLSGEQIPLASRILAVADAYVSVVRERPFSSPKSSEEAVAMLETFSGTQFDAVVVDAFLRLLRGESVAQSTSA